MKLQVIQIDAWADGYDWYYNQVFPLKKVYIDGEPTKCKLVHALRRNGYINKDIPISDFYLDDFLSDEGTWTIQQAKDYMPLFDLKEVS